MISSETLRRFMSSDESAMYLFSEETLQRNLDAILNAFKAYYENFHVAYSFKTNYLKTVCEKMLTNGEYAEVVSPNEYDYARAVGFRPERIVYNGVIPDLSGKYYVLENGGMVNVDNIAEYRAIAAKAKYHKKHVRIGVRVNFDVGNNIVSRFGVDADGEEFAQLMKEIADSQYVKLGGFHTHIGSSRQLQYWEAKIDRMIELAKQWNVEYIDLGGGMFGQMPEELSSQFNGYVGNFDEYAKVIGPRMREAFPNNEVALFLEPGTAMVGNTMKVAAKVTNIKKVQDQIYITVGCCGNHIGMLCECRDIPAEVYQDENKIVYRMRVKNAIICGNTCLEFDYIKKGFNALVGVGDVIVFDNCGAYSISASRQFIVPRLPVYEAESGKRLVNCETAFDMFGKYLTR